MMIEASPVKFYVARFTFLVFACVQWITAVVLLFQLRFTTKSLVIAVLLISLGVIFFYVFLLVNDKVKRVAIGKNKIIIIEGDKNSRFKWPEVKSLKNIPIMNLYKLKLKGKKSPVYFFLSRKIDPGISNLSRELEKGRTDIKEKED